MMSDTSRKDGMSDVAEVKEALELLRKAVDHPGSLDWKGEGNPWRKEVVDLWWAAARRWDEFPSDEDVRAFMECLADYEEPGRKTGWLIPREVRAGLEAVKARETP